MAGLYQNLPLRSNRDVRLLYLTPAEHEQALTARIEVVSLDERPDYIALSYTWGEPRFDAKLICNGREVQITSNLHAALLRMRKTDKRAFWVDQLCINQNDLVERGQQVTLMRDIFRSAANVYLWLGPHTDYTSEGIDLVKRFARDEPLDDFIAETNHRTAENVPLHFQGVKRGFDEIFASPWFTRLWVIQEATANPHAIAFIGDYECAWSDIAAAAAKQMEETPGKIRSELAAVGPTAAAKWGQIRCITIAFLFGDTVNHIAPTIAQRLRTSAFGKLMARLSDPLVVMAAGNEFEVTDPRDRVYALLSFIDGDDDSLVPDYSLSVGDVYYQFSEHCVRQGQGLRLITRCAATAVQGTEGLPSWCADLGSDEECATSFTELASRSFATAIDLPNELICRNSQERTLSLEGVFVDEITTVGPVHTKVGVWPQTLARWLYSSIEVLMITCASSPSQERNIPTDIETAHESMRKFARVLVADDPRYRDSSYARLREFVPYIDNMLEAICTARTSADDGASEVSHDFAAAAEWANDPFIRAVWHVTRLRRFCMTSPSSKNLMGLVQGQAEIGDQVWILPGAEVPVCLRPYNSIETREDQFEGKRNKTFELVGDAFLLGIMDGEAVKEDWFRSERITLY